MSGQRVEWSVIQRSLEERGLWNADGITRKARARFCQHCPAPVIAGLDHERVAAAVYLDPTPLNAKGEALALLAGRRTYSLRWTNGHYVIDVRFAEHIAGSPAGTSADIEILATHICNSAPTPAPLTGPGLTRPTTSFGDDLDTPPF